MANNKSLKDIWVVVWVIICMLLIVGGLVVNLANEIESRGMPADAVTPLQGQYQPATGAVTVWGF